MSAFNWLILFEERAMSVGVTLQRSHTGSLMGIKSEEGLVPANQLKKSKQKVRESERMLGKMTMQVE